MKKNSMLALAATAILAVAALPLAAQTVVLKANVPFPYSIGTAAVPAGEYEITKDMAKQVVILREASGALAAGSLVTRSGRGASDIARDTRLVFNQYGDRYFLAEVVDGSTGTAVVLPQTNAERELAQTASVQRTSVMAVLARR